MCLPGTEFVKLIHEINFIGDNVYVISGENNVAHVIIYTPVSGNYLSNAEPVEPITSLTGIIPYWDSETCNHPIWGDLEQRKTCTNS